MDGERKPPRSEHNRQKKTKRRSLVFSYERDNLERSLNGVKHLIQLLLAEVERFIDVLDNIFGFFLLFANHTGFLHK